MPMRFPFQIVDIGDSSPHKSNYLTSLNNCLSSDAKACGYIASALLLTKYSPDNPVHMFYRAPSEIAQCPSCGNRSIHLGFRAEKRLLAPGKHVWFISGCEACGLVFANPPPPQEVIDGHYVEDGDWAAQKLKPSSWVKRQQRPLKARHLAIVDILDRVTKSDQSRRVLDFGCGPGQVLRGLKEQGWETYGIDPMSAHLLGEYGHTMLDEMPAVPMFDAIVMNHVLEHLQDPLGVLSQAGACIRSGGHIYVGTPTLDRLHEHGKHAYCINRKFHLSAFTKRSMTSLLAKAGFQVIDVCDSGAPQRIALLARQSDATDSVQLPLQDAERELCSGKLLPIRFAAGAANLEAAYGRAVRKTIKTYNRRARKLPHRIWKKWRRGSSQLRRTVRSLSRRLGRQ